MKFDDFMQVSESLPLRDASVDAVIGTLVLCSVADVNLTLQGIYFMISYPVQFVGYSLSCLLY